MKPQNGSKNVQHLKKNGSWTYRRRVPERHHKTLGFKVWNRPCGDLSYQQAVVMITDWSAEDDALITSLDDPKKAAKVRQDTETSYWEPYIERLAVRSVSAISHDRLKELRTYTPDLRQPDRRCD